MTPLSRIVSGPDGAPTLVLLHGITGSAVSLAEAIDHWVGRGYRVLAVDARGHGLSPRWTQARLERAGEVLVEDLVAVLEDLETASRGRAALGLSTPPAPVVIGHSMGAATAMVAAGRRPDLVSGVVLEDPARFGTRSPRELLARGAARERARAAEVADLPAAVGRALETMPDAEALPGVWASQRTDPGLLLTGVVAPEVPWDEAMAALDAVGLAHRAGDHVQVFSGGQAQRVLIARALVRSPELLILDEPLAGIDRASRESLAEILQGLRAQGLTLVTVLHEMGELADVVQRAILLQDGRLVADGPAGEVAHLRDSRVGASHGPRRTHSGDDDHHPDAGGPPAHHAPVLDHRLPDTRPHSGRSTRP